MKRTRAISILTLAIASGVALVGCGGTEPTQTESQEFALKKVKAHASQQSIEATECAAACNKPGCSFLDWDWTCKMSPGNPNFQPGGYSVYSSPAGEGLQVNFTFAATAYGTRRLNELVDPSQLGFSVAMGGGGNYSHAEGMFTHFEDATAVSETVAFPVFAGWSNGVWAGAGPLVPSDLGEVLLVMEVRTCPAKPDGGLCPTRGNVDRVTFSQIVGW